MADNLIALLAELRPKLSGISDETWTRIIVELQASAGGRRVYVPAGNAKKSHLEILAEHGQTHDLEQLSRMMGVSVRRVRQLRKMVE